MTRSGPTVSVIVASTGPLPERPACLTPLIHALRREPLEIIVAHCADREAPPAWTAICPDVTMLRLPPASTLPAVLSAALGQSKGPIIGILDARCGLDENWVAATLAAHQAPDPVIGGAVEPGELRGPVAWAAYFSDYGRFMRPLSRHPARHVPGINVTLKRWALAHGREFVDGEFWKSYWCRQLQAVGIDLVVDPALVVYYRRTVGLHAFLGERFHHGRCFAGMRRSQLTRAGRIAYAIGAPALPLLFCVRILGAVLPKRRRLGALGCALPVVVLGTVAWALGELCGYVAGPGQSCRYVR